MATTLYVRVLKALKQIIIQLLAFLLFREWIFKKFQQKIVWTYPVNGRFCLAFLSDWLSGLKKKLLQFKSESTKSAFKSCGILSKNKRAAEGFWLCANVEHGDAV
jgi:hypothetical protein